jgi:hypothetical protein
VALVTQNQSLGWANHSRILPREKDQEKNIFYEKKNEKTRKKTKQTGLKRADGAGQTFLVYSREKQLSLYSIQIKVLRVYIYYFFFFSDLRQGKRNDTFYTHILYNRFGDKSDKSQRDETSD